MKTLLYRLWRDEEGQDLVEYALLLVLMSLAAVATVGGLATAVNNAFDRAASNVAT